VSLLGQNLVDLGVTTRSIYLSSRPRISDDAGARSGHRHIKHRLHRLGLSRRGQVHLDLFDNNGKEIGSDFIVPNATSLLRIHDINNGPRIEIDYTVSDGHGGQNVVAAIYDTSAYSEVGGGALTLNDSGGVGLWRARPTATPSFGPRRQHRRWRRRDRHVRRDRADGLASASLDRPAREVALSDGAGDIDTLRRFSSIDLSDATIAINGDTLTQTNSDGSKSYRSTISAASLTRALSLIMPQAGRDLGNLLQPERSIYSRPRRRRRSPPQLGPGRVGENSFISGLSVSEIGAVSSETFT